jgi:hypothetical protein
MGIRVSLEVSNIYALAPVIIQILVKHILVVKSQLLISPGSLAGLGLTILSLGGKVLEAALGVGLHGLSALLPASRAHLAVLVGELEGLDKTDGLLDVTADGKVVDGDLAEDTLGVDDEETAKSDTLVLNQDTVVARDLGGLVGDEGELQVGTETTLLARLLNPGKMGEVGVGGDTENSGVDLLEAVEGVVVLDDLGRADEGEVHGVEEEDDPVGDKLAMRQTIRVFGVSTIVP